MSRVARHLYRSIRPQLGLRKATFFFLLFASTDRLGAVPNEWRSEGIDKISHSVYFKDTMTGAELRRARHRLGLSQTGLAEAIGMRKNSVARMERSESPVMKHTELAVKYLLLTVEKGSQRRKTHGRKTRAKND
jgi:DNA-binding XRE family transcriptional regulator